jgi:hypothetical protein
LRNLRFRFLHFVLAEDPEAQSSRLLDRVR